MNPSTVTLEIEPIGLEAEFVLPLGECLRVGSGTSMEIPLPDSGLDDHHLTVERRADGRIHIVFLGAGKVSKGGICGDMPVELPAKFQACSLRFKLEGQHEIAPKPYFSLGHSVNASAVVSRPKMSHLQFFATTLTLALAGCAAAGTWWMIKGRARALPTESVTPNVEVSRSMILPHSSPPGDVTRRIPDFDGGYLVTKSAQIELKPRKAENAKVLPLEYTTKNFGAAPANLQLHPTLYQVIPGFKAIVEEATKDFTTPPICNYTLDGPKVSTTVRASDFTGFMLQGSHDFQSVSLYPLQAKYLGRDMHFKDATALPAHGEPFYMGDDTIPLKSRSLSETTYYFQPEKNLPIGFYAAWLSNTFWIFALTDDQDTPISFARPTPIPVAREAFTNSLGMKFLPIPGTDVLFCEHETRVKDYAAYASSKPINMKWQDTEFHRHQTGDHPVIMVTKYAAKDFCDWLSEKEGKIYRLPTDHEWSVAVGIGDREDPTQTPQEKRESLAYLYPWGNAWPPPKVAGNFELDSDPFRYTAPVGSFELNHHGIKDLSGNVKEWCEGLFSNKPSGRYADLTSTTQVIYHVTRGGGWQDKYESSLRSAERSPTNPDSRSIDIGFRCVVVSVPSGDAVPTPQNTVAIAPVPRKPFANSLGMTFVPVPGTDALFCQHETRVQDYAPFAAANPGINMDWQYAELEGDTQEPDHPVVSVDWEEARAFCVWLSEKEGKPYRLPTDHEWSVAVGIGSLEDPKASPEDKSKKTGFVPGYPWGKTWPPPKGAENLNNFCFEDYRHMDSHRFTAPVMSFKIGLHGLYDMGGNVSEWCEDFYCDSPSLDSLRVIRGGTCGYYSNIRGAEAQKRHLESSYRSHNHTGHKSSLCGFRCVVSAPRNPTDMDPAVELSVRLEELAPSRAILKLKNTVIFPPVPRKAFTNSLGMNFLPVPGTNALFCEHETRVKDYSAYAAANPKVNKGWKDAVWNELKQEPDQPNHPVVNVKWQEAKAFCEWLSAQEGKPYRLPTDHEWSMAIGIGHLENPTVSPEMKDNMISGYTWGRRPIRTAPDHVVMRDWPPPNGAGNFGIDKREYEDSHPFTAPVKSYNVGKYGLYDILGNVGEWCEDLHSVEEPDRVVRGGSWATQSSVELYRSCRFDFSPGKRRSDVGFRCVVNAGN